MKPILLYGSELWSVFNINMCRNGIHPSDFSLEKHYDDFLPEKIHSRFCKFILGVGKYTSNIASKAELGRYPLYCVSTMFPAVTAATFQTTVSKTG